MSTQPLGTFPDRHTFQLEVRYSHPASRVWKAITEPDQIAVWFMPSTIEPRVGGRFVVWRDEAAGVARAEGTVTVWKPEAALELRLDHGNMAAVPEQIVCYELYPEPEGCRLVFTSRLRPDAVPEARFIDQQIAGPGTHIPGTCAGWHGFFQEGLSRFLDGRGAPIYDASDDAIMVARDKQYQAVVQEPFTAAP